MRVIKKSFTRQLIGNILIQKLIAAHLKIIGRYKQLLLFKMYSDLRRNEDAGFADLFRACCRKEIVGIGVLSTLRSRQYMHY